MKNLLLKRNHIEVSYPEEGKEKILFQVFFNGILIASAQLELESDNTSNSVVTNDDSKVISMFNPEDGPVYCIKMIEVSKNYRRLGIGTTLLREVIHYCELNKIQKLTAEIRGDVAALVVWYRKNGFIDGKDYFLEYITSH